MFRRSLTIELQQMSLAYAVLSASSSLWIPMQALGGWSASGIVCITRSIFRVRTATLMTLPSYGADRTSEIQWPQVCGGGGGDLHL